MKRALWITSLTLALLVVAAVVAFKVSPWPSALVIRAVFERTGAETNAALAAHVPPGIESQQGLQYDPGDPDALLDIHRPGSSEGRPLPVIVWLHGGGFVAGSRAEVANYARILAADGYAVATVDYALAPGTRYPVPVQQVNLALAYLSDNAAKLGLERNRFILGGDSAGAQLAAQVAALVTSPQYASSMRLRPGLTPGQLRGAILFCGPHDAQLMASKGSQSWFVRTVVWSYLGSVPTPAILQEFSVVPNVTSSFPPTFITVGNADPLAPQSYSLAEELQRQGIRVDSLFFPVSHGTALGHEYQFDFSFAESRQALDRVRSFLRSLETGQENRVEVPAGQP